MSRLTVGERLAAPTWPERADAGRITLRRAGPCDVDGLGAMLERCSLASRYGRFLGPLRRWPMGHLEAVTSTGEGVEGWIAVLDDDEGRVLALASLHRQGPDAAEIAVLIEDGWQQAGVGTSLLRLLGVRARAQGISTLNAVVLSEHAHVLRLLQAVFGPARLAQETGTTSVSIRLDHPA